MADAKVTATDTHAPDISVIIPTYNRLWSLPRAVESCRRTQCKVQIVVVDDGSHDGTWEWLQLQADLVALRQPNLGKGWAVTRGMSVATGRYVKFLDSDDAVAPGAIDRQLAIADGSGTDLVFSGIEIVNEGGAVLWRRPLSASDDFIAQQLGEGDGSHYSAFLFRREFVIDIPHRTEYGAVDDRMFILEVALAHPKVVSDPEPALVHTDHTRDRMQGYQGMRAVVTNHQRVQLFRRILERLRDAGELTERRRRAVAPILWSLSHWIAYTSPDEGELVAEWVQRLVPGFVPPDRGAAGVAYRALGFRWAERLFRVRRSILGVIRRRPSIRPETFPA